MNSSAWEDLGAALTRFEAHYGAVHPALSIGVCLFGILANTLNVAVLTRPHMASATNSLLCALSSTQLLLLLNYFLLQIYARLKRNCVGLVWSWGGAVYMKINVNLSVFFHTVALSFTLCLALFRYMAIRFPHKAQYWLRRSTALCWICGAIAFQAVACTPVYLSNFPANVSTGFPDCGLVRRQFDLIWNPDDRIHNAIFAVLGILCNFIPCCLLTFLSVGLLQSLREVEQRRGELLNKVSSKNLKANRRHERRRTIMLVVVVLLCLVVELPHGVLKILVSVYGMDFADKVYTNIGDFIDFLTLLYSSINFIVYCVMNSEFRTTFLRLYCVAFVSKGVSKSVSETRRTIRRRTRSVPKQNPDPPSPACPLEDNQTSLLKQIPEDAQL